MTDHPKNLYEIKVPELGESILEATVVRWLKKEGDAINAGDPLVELETSKVNLEVPATVSGTLKKIVHGDNEDVRVGDVLALLLPEKHESTGPGATVEKETDQAAPSPAPTAGGSSRQASHEKATPVARRMAEEQGIDLGQLSGTGPGGRISKTDVVHFAAEQTPPEEAPTTPAPKVASPERREERIKLSRRRRTIAESLIQAQQTAAMLTTFNELDMTAVMELRRRRNETFLARYGVKLGIVSFFIKAVVGALKGLPEINSELQGVELIVKHYYDIGIAVAAPGGLVVPVIHDADRLNFVEIEKAIHGFTDKAEHNAFTLDDLRGGTFTITNGGVFGSLMSTPILTYPQAAILGLHKIEKRPVVVDDAIVIRPMMYAALTYDHRIVDGQQAVTFLASVKSYIEDPEKLLLEA